MRIGVVLCLLCAGVWGCTAPEPIVYDVQISGGLVYDGTSNTGRRVDVFHEGDEITFIGAPDAGKVTAKTVVDVTGLIVAPGFIDPHTHTLSDVMFASRGQRLDGYLTQGVTTVVAGNDGGGPVDIGSALQAVEAQGVGPNFALFAGHGSLRGEVLGRENRPPNEAELTDMKGQLGKALEEGALGLSTGLYYAPASYAQIDEIVALAEVAAAYGALYESHIRDESSYSVGLIGAVEEALEIGRRSGAAVHIAHIKALGVDVWGQSADVIAMIEAAQAEGLVVTADLDDDLEIVVPVHRNRTWKRRCAALGTLEGGARVDLARGADGGADGHPGGEGGVLRHLDEGRGVRIEAFAGGRSMAWRQRLDHLLGLR